MVRELSCGVCQIGWQGLIGKFKLMRNLFGILRKPWLFRLHNTSPFCFPIRYYYSRRVIGIGKRFM